jgi:cell division protein FtsB
MQRVRQFFRNSDAGPFILRLEKQATWGRLDAPQFRRVFALVSVVAVCLLLLTWSRVRVLANGYQIMELKAERDAMLAEHRRLERRLEEMQSLNYAEQVARQRLGMVDINPNQVITLRKKSAAESLMDDVASFFGGKPEAEKRKR